MMDHILILHLSDLHFGMHNRFNELGPKELAARFNTAIEEAKKDLLIDAEINLVVVTGDIVESGLPKEYIKAKEFLECLSEELKVNRKYFIFAPGNHDICWLDSERAELEQKRDEFDEAELSRRINTYKFETFKSFLWSFYGITSPGLSHELERNSFVYDFDEIKLSIAALNSCEVESHRETDHKGVLSREQAQSVMDHWQKGEYTDWVKIAAIHHNPVPIGHEDRGKWNKYLEEQQKNGSLTASNVQRYESDILGLEGANFLKGLARECQIQLVLHGHQHASNEESWPRKNGNGYIDILSAGSFGLDTDKLPKFQKNSFRLILLNIRDKRLFSTMRVYEPTAQANGVIDQGHFVPDPSGRGIYKQPNLFLPSIFESENDNIKSESTVDYSSFTDYTSSIQSFIDNYLGTPDQPVPFGGRERDLKYLDDWLDNPEAPPYLLLAAPAGRGKSALLVRWRERLLARKEIAVVFVPVSIRYSTNLESVVFTALTARLAMLHGDKPPDPNASTPTLRGMMMDYLSRPLPDGQRLLVILDGVDEAADWEAGPYLFPANSPKSLRVIVSARYLAGDVDATSWLRRLGWNRKGLACAPFLNLLSREGVSDVLYQMGFPLTSLCERVDIIHELYRLSEGDPLILRLYVDDLWRKGEEAARLQPDDLRVLEPGLEGYFEDWWKYQRSLWDKQCEKKGSSMPLCEPPVCELLNILACAKGPLNRNDLLRLVSPEVKMSTWIFEESLKSLERIVIGDGVKQGYAFSHPRLGSYFYDKLVDSDRENVETRFIDYGKDTLEALNKGALQPNKASRYIVQYYGAHLEYSHGSVEAFLSLISRGWLRAWEAQEGAYSGFLNDVGRVWRELEQTDLMEIEEGKKARYFGKAILCALCFASVNSLSANIPTELLVLLIKNKIWNPTQGLAYARQNPTVEFRAIALSEISLQFEEPQKTDILREALSVARKIKANFSKSSALAKIAFKLSDIDEALSVAREIEYEEGRVSALIQIATKLLEPQKTDVLAEALSVAREIEDEAERVMALTEIATNLPEPQKTDVLAETLLVSRDIKDKGRRVRALVQIATNLPEPQKTDVLEEAFSVAREIEDEAERVMDLTEIATNLPEPQKKEILAEALSMAKGIEDELERSLAMCLIASDFSDASEALSIAREIGDEEDKAIALSNIALGLFDLTEALSIAREIEYYEERVDVLVEIALRLPEPQKTNVLAEALSLAREINHKDMSVRALVKIVPNLPEPQKTDVIAEVLSLARMIEDVGGRARTLTKIAPNLPESRKIEVFAEALSLAREIEYYSEMVGALVEIASNLLEPQKTNILAEALSEAREIEDEYERARALVQIATNLPEPQKTEVLSETLSVAKKIKDEDRRIEVLVEIALGLPEPQKTNVLAEALSLAREINHKDMSVRALVKIVPNLPEPQKTDVIAEALSMVRMIKNEGDRARSLAEIAPILSDPKEALSLVRKIEDTDMREMALAKIAPMIPDPCEALSIAREFNLGSYFASGTLAKIAPKLPDMIETLSVARAIEDENERIRAMAEIALKLPEPQKADVLVEVLVTAREIDYEHSRTLPLIKIAPLLAGQSPTRLFPLWCETLHILAQRTRKDLLSDIVALSPIIAALSDSQSIEDLVQAILDMGQWWP